MNTTSSNQHHQHNTINTSSSTHHHQHNIINTTPSTHHQHKIMNTTSGSFCVAGAKSPRHNPRKTRTKSRKSRKGTGKGEGKDKGAKSGQQQPLAPPPPPPLNGPEGQNPPWMNMPLPPGAASASSQALPPAEHKLKEISSMLKRANPETLTPELQNFVAEEATKPFWPHPTSWHNGEPSFLHLWSVSVSTRNTSSNKKPHTRRILRRHGKHWSKPKQITMPRRRGPQRSRTTRTT